MLCIPRFSYVRKGGWGSKRPRLTLALDIQTIGRVNFSFLSGFAFFFVDGVTNLSVMLSFFVSRSDPLYFSWLSYNSRLVPNDAIRLRVDCRLLLYHLDCEWKSSGVGSKQETRKVYKSTKYCVSSLQDAAVGCSSLHSYSLFIVL